MVFSWPSKAGLFDYAYDRESAMWSRDDFERVLRSIVTTPSAGRVHIVAHSMGTMLTLESLRQLHARYGDTVADRIGAWCSLRRTSTWMCSRRRSTASVCSPATSPSSPRQTTARWRCRGKSPVG